MTTAPSVEIVREKRESREGERIVGRLRMLCRTFGFVLLLKALAENACGGHRPAALKAVGFSKGRNDVDSPTRSMVVVVRVQG